jgi:hypothetical protein
MTLRAVATIALAVVATFFGVAGLWIAYATESTQPLTYIVPGFALVMVVVAMVAFVRALRTRR